MTYDNPEQQTQNSVEQMPITIRPDGTLLRMERWEFVVDFFCEKV